MPKWQVRLIQAVLANGWLIKKSRSHAAMIIGHQDFEISALISTVGDLHWSHDYNEVIFYEVSAGELSRKHPVEKLGDSWRFGDWFRLKKFLGDESKVNFSRQ